MNRHEGSTCLRSNASRLGMLTLAFALALSPALVAAKPGTRNLGGGLEQDISAPAKSAKSLTQSQAAARSAGGLTHPVIRDAAGRALVRITLDGKVPAATVIQGLKSTAGVEVKATDLKYRKGVVEAYVPAAALAAVAGRKGVLAVVPSSPRVTNVGATTSQGVVQHRVDKLPAGVDGSGITVGVLSDSYDTTTFFPIHAADDIASGDLPGPGNPFGNTQPVVVLEDIAGGTIDEGRAMLQIIHDLAPKARLGFATAFTGEIGFADNIRGLAGFLGAPNTVPGFKSDIIVDDVIYLAEPFFQDGIIAQAVDEVAAAGVSYFSSAGNRPATEAYDSKVRIVPPSSTASSGLNFADVPAALYAGGFHDFAEGGGVDISQTIQFSDDSIIVFQWNEVFDPPPPTPGAVLASGTGTVPETPALGPQSFDTFTFNGTAGMLVEIFIDEFVGVPPQPNPDLLFFLFDPNDEQIAFVDTGTNPESLTLELPATGEYTVVVGSFDPFPPPAGGGQFGDYSYLVQEILITEVVLSDYNLLFFLDGEFIGASAEQNLFSNRPIELVGLFGATLEMVISRANTPPSNNRNVADRIRYVGFGGVFPQEYFSYLGPVTYGHSSAAGAMGVAAYPFYAPFVPEPFTSPGPSTIYFDKNNNRFRHPQIRQKPDMAAMDGANTSFFFSDASQDPDTFPNFFGTSASAPHAAAIAALVLDAAGGPGKVKPNNMRKILQDSAFRHDLDPYNSTGFALTKWNLLSINASADGNAGSQFDPNVFTLWHIGNKRLQSFSINGSGGNPTQTPKGIVFDERVGPGQPFVVGDTNGLVPADVTSGFSLPADSPGLAGQWKQLNLSFLAGTFGSGDRLSFGVDRDEADAAGPNGAVGGNSADLLGGGILLPQGTLAPGGARFFGTYEGGTTFSSEFFNVIGNGYSQLDGYGFINAEAAVKAATKKK